MSFYLALFHILMQQTEKHSPISRVRAVRLFSKMIKSKMTSEAAANTIMWCYPSLLGLKYFEFSDPNHPALRFEEST